MGQTVPLFAPSQRAAQTVIAHDDLRGALRWREARLRLSSRRRCHL
jgi:hypothetical protein